MFEIDNKQLNLSQWYVLHYIICSHGLVKYSITFTEIMTRITEPLSSQICVNTVAGKYVKPSTTYILDNEDLFKCLCDKKDEDDLSFIVVVIKK